MESTFNKWSLTWIELFSNNKSVIGWWPITIIHRSQVTWPITTTSCEFNWQISDLIIRFFRVTWFKLLSRIADTYGIFLKLLRYCKLESCISTEREITYLPNGSTLHTQILKFAGEKWSFEVINLFNGYIWWFNIIWNIIGSNKLVLSEIFESPISNPSITSHTSQPATWPMTTTSCEFHWQLSAMS